MNIPKIIHNIWIQGYDNLPNENKLNIQKIKKLNPEWEFMIWDENMILRLLKKYPKVLNVYKNVKNYSGFINTEASKSDIARYIIMKEYGGLYYDLDFQCVTTFDKLFDNSDKPIEDELSNNDDKTNTNHKIYMASSKIDFLDYVNPFFKPKYCACFMAFEKEHPIWDKVINRILKATDKYSIGNALDYELQQSNFKVFVLERVNGHYQCINKDSVCYTPAISSWNPIRPIFKNINCYYKQILLLLLVVLIIIVVDRITQYNMAIYSMVSFIPGLTPPTQQNQQNQPNKNLLVEKRKERKNK